MAGECVQPRAHSRRMSSKKAWGVIYMYSPITWEAEAGGWLVQGQPELHSALCKEEVGGLAGQFRD